MIISILYFKYFFLILYSLLITLSHIKFFLNFYFLIYINDIFLFKIFFLILTIMIIATSLILFLHFLIKQLIYLKALFS